MGWYDNRNEVKTEIVSSMVYNGSSDGDFAFLDFVWDFGNADNGWMLNDVTGALDELVDECILEESDEKGFYRFSPCVEWRGVIEKDGYEKIEEYLDEEAKKGFGYDDEEEEEDEE